MADGQERGFLQDNPSIINVEYGIIDIVHSLPYHLLLPSVGIMYEARKKINQEVISTKTTVHARSQEEAATVCS